MFTSISAMPRARNLSLRVELEVGLFSNPL